jgi:hypothetical protein
MHSEGRLLDHSEQESRAAWSQRRYDESRVYNGKEITMALKSCQWQALAIMVGFQSTEEKKSDGVISGLYGGCGMRLNRETYNFSRVALAV